MTREQYNTLLDLLTKAEDEACALLGKFEPPVRNPIWMLRAVDEEGVHFETSVSSRGCYMGDEYATVPAAAIIDSEADAFWKQREEDRIKKEAQEAAQQEAQKQQAQQRQTQTELKELDRLKAKYPNQ